MVVVQRANLREVMSRTTDNQFLTEAYVAFELTVDSSILYYTILYKQLHYLHAILSVQNTQSSFQKLKL